MKGTFFPTSFALAFLALGCSGSTRIGQDADGGAGGNGTGGSAATAMGGGSSVGGNSTMGSGGTAGNANGGSGGTNATVCQNKPCGSACSPCSAQDMNCSSNGPSWFCDAGGQCVPEYPMCQAEQCETSMDCVQLGAPCEQCPDGTSACPFVDCIMGQCVGSFPTCTTTACMSDDDCPVSLAPCQMCADGTVACPWARCENGVCANGIDACGDEDPCAGKQCGDSCSTCDEGGSCNDVVMYCNAELECQPNAPMCTTSACMSDDDCPGVGACPPCDDPNVCAEMKCVNGACAFQCPVAGCAGQGESCAGGETCCSGMTCCAGVPIPEGQEYCSDLCPVSDVNMKRNFTSVDPDKILERLATLPIATWSYRTESAHERHIGPMAQDFMATFGVGSSDRTILQVDADGVAFAAIQALYARLKAVEADNARLERALTQSAERSRMHCE